MPKSCPTEHVAGRPKDKVKQKEREVTERRKERGRKRILEK